MNRTFRALLDTDRAFNDATARQGVEGWVTRDGQRIVFGKGKYITLWRKQADGAWKAEADIGNPGNPEGNP